MLKVGGLRPFAAEGVGIVGRRKRGFVVDDVACRAQVSVVRDLFLLLVTSSASPGGLKNFVALHRRAIVSFSDFLKEKKSGKFP